MLGEQIRNIRKSRDFTLKALAEQTGLSIGYISQIERNLTDPSLSTLRKISAALDVPTYLFMGEAEADNTLTTRKNQVITLSQPHSNIRYHPLFKSGKGIPNHIHHGVADGRSRIGQELHAARCIELRHSIP